MFPFTPKRDLFPPPQFQMPQQVDNTQDNTQQPMSVTPPNPPDDFATRMRQIYESSNGPATKTYSDYLKTMPSNYKPDFATRLGATLSGAGAGWRHPEEGGLVAQQILDAPRVRALQDWSTKATALKAGADLEDKSITQKINTEKELDTRDRERNKDSNIKRLQDAQIANYESLKKERDRGKVSYHEDKTSGHLWAINEDGTKKDLGVMDLTPEQKADLQVKTSGREEDNRNRGRKDLFNFTNPLITTREKDVHSTNRAFDRDNPVRAAASGYESIDQQNKAITAAAKELNIEAGGKYNHLFNQDGTLVSPNTGEGFFSGPSNTKELQDFYKLATARAAEKLNLKRGSQSTATTFPPVTVDPRIQR